MALGDGARVELSEDLSAENLMILTRGQGERGHLLGAISNRSDQAVQVSIDPGDGDAFTIDAPARSKVNLTHAGPVIEAVEMRPGQHNRRRCRLQGPAPSPSRCLSWMAPCRTTTASWTA